MTESGFHKGAHLICSGWKAGSRGLCLPRAGLSEAGQREEEGENGLGSAAVLQVKPQLGLTALHQSRGRFR